MATTAEVEKVAVEVRDRVFDAAAVRVRAARVEVGFKALAKEAHELASRLDGEEEKAVKRSEEGDQQMLFDTQDAATLCKEETQVCVLECAVKAASKIVTIEPDEAVKLAKKILRDA